MDQACANMEVGLISFLVRHWSDCYRLRRIIDFCGSVYHFCRAVYLLYISEDAVLSKCKVAELDLQAVPAGFK